jgi:hypothetical protein
VAFVGAHFAANHDKVAERNADFHRTNDELPLRCDVRGGGGGGAQAAAAAAAAESTPLADRFEWTFFLGDLNYRIEGTRACDVLSARQTSWRRCRGMSEPDHNISINQSSCVPTRAGGLVEKLIARRARAVLRNNDQLLTEMKRGRVFAGYREGKLDFDPTYKFDVGTSSYDSSSKQRIPAWTDRVLYSASSEKAAAKLQLREYGCCAGVLESDHKPVFARFAAQVDGAAAASQLVDASSSGSGTSVCVIS